MYSFNHKYKNFNRRACVSDNLLYNVIISHTPGNWFQNIYKNFNLLSKDNKEYRI